MRIWTNSSACLWVLGGGGKYIYHGNKRRHGWGISNPYHVCCFWVRCRTPLALTSTLVFTVWVSGRIVKWVKCFYESTFSLFFFPASFSLPFQQNSSHPRARSDFWLSIWPYLSQRKTSHKLNNRAHSKSPNALTCYLTQFHFTDINGVAILC